MGFTGVNIIFPSLAQNKLFVFFRTDDVVLTSTRNLWRKNKENIRLLTEQEVQKDLFGSTGTYICNL